jgi:hypothetical protein
VIRTINLFTKAVPDTPTSWLGKFSFVWLVQAIIAERFGFGASRRQRCQVTDLAE